MSSTSVVNSAETIPDAIAPWWHTVLVLATLAVMSIASWYQQGLPNAHLPGMSRRLSSYFTVLVAELFQVLLIWLALNRRGLLIGSMVAGRWKTVGNFFRDLGLGVAFIAVAVPLTGVLAYWLGGSNNSALANVTPKTLSELVVFLAVAIVGGGFCEELIFRGYLMRQFSAWTGSRLFALILQGIVFGLAHGFYGRLMVVVMIQGWLLGWLAQWRKSLRPGMLAHGLQDVIGGVAAFLS